MTRAQKRVLYVLMALTALALVGVIVMSAGVRHVRDASDGLPIGDSREQVEASLRGFRHERISLDEMRSEYPEWKVDARQGYRVYRYWFVVRRFQFVLVFDSQDRLKHVVPTYK